MQARLFHHGSEWLSGDYEPPQPYANDDFLSAMSVHRDANEKYTGMKLTPGSAIWDASGKLLLFLAKGADLAWTRQPNELLSLEQRFLPCKHGPGTGHVLRRLESGSFRELGTIEICIPTGGVEYLILDHSGRKCLATWLQQNEWGYVAVDLDSSTQLPGGLHWPSATISPPAFSPDDAFVVSCNFLERGWWTNKTDEYWEHASPGGLRKVGTISVHELRTDKISHHDVFIKLRKGWLPEEADRPDWSMIWGPEFVSNREFRIWLPDETVEELKLPLPPRVEITRPLGTTRQWLD